MKIVFRDPEVRCCNLLHRFQKVLECDFRNRGNDDRTHIRHLRHPVFRLLHYLESVEPDELDDVKRPVFLHLLLTSRSSNDPGLYCLSFDLRSPAFVLAFPVRWETVVTPNHAIVVPA